MIELVEAEAEVIFGLTVKSATPSSESLTTLRAGVPVIAYIGAVTVIVLSDQELTAVVNQPVESPGPTKNLTSF